MKTLIAFDFDGTLYPILNKESEQLLMLHSTKGKSLEEEAKIAVLKDKRRELTHQEFNEAFKKYVLGATEEDIEVSVNELVSVVDRKEYEGLKELSKKADLIVISCGTVVLAKGFLENLGVLDCFTSFYGKELIMTNNHVSDVKFNIPDFEAKAEVIKSYRDKYDYIIAVGDGPTDIPMLESADKGFIIDLIDAKMNYKFETVTSIKELTEKLIALC